MRIRGKQGGHLEWCGDFGSSEYQAPRLWGAEYGPATRVRQYVAAPLRDLFTDESLHPATDRGGLWSVCVGRAQRRAEQVLCCAVLYCAVQRGDVGGGEQMLRLRYSEHVVAWTYVLQRRQAFHYRNSCSSCRVPAAPWFPRSRGYYHPRDQAYARDRGPFHN